MLCIPVNIAIIYFCGDSTYLKQGSSSYVKYMQEQDEEVWTVANIILLAVLVEHLLLFIKVIIANLIPDVPNKVIESEKKRPKVLKKAQQYLLEVEK